MEPTTPTATPMPATEQTGIGMTISPPEIPGAPQFKAADLASPTSNSSTEGLVPPPIEPVIPAMTNTETGLGGISPTSNIAEFNASPDLASQSPTTSTTADSVSPLTVTPNAAEESSSLGMATSSLPTTETTLPIAPAESSPLAVSELGTSPTISTEALTSMTSDSRKDEPLPLSMTEGSPEPDTSSKWTTQTEEATNGTVSTPDLEVETSNVSLVDQMVDAAKKAWEDSEGIRALAKKAPTDPKAAAEFQMLATYATFAANSKPTSTS